MMTLEQAVVSALRESPLWHGMPEKEKIELFWHTYLLWASIYSKEYICIQ